MKPHISPFPFSDYRDYLRTALKENGFSYRSFAARYGNIVSFITLAQVLSRGKAGLRNRPTRNLSPEALARLGKVFRLSDAEVAYLVLLKLENDSEALPGQYGGACLEAVRLLIREQKERAMREKPLEDSGLHFSRAAVAMAELFDQLPQSKREKILEDVVVEAKGTVSRMHRRPGVRVIQDSLQKLETLRDMGLH